MKTRTQILLSIFSGILVFLSFPTMIAGVKFPNFGILGWIALTPLFISLNKTSPRKAFCLTFLSASIWYGGSLYWIYNAVRFYGHLSFIASASITILLVVIVALYISIAPLLVKLIGAKYENIWTSEHLLIPIFWTAMEFCRNWLPCNGFPWANIAMSQFSNTFVIQIVDIAGVYGLIFVMVWVNFYIAELLLFISKLDDVKQMKLKTAATAAIIMLVLGYGVFRAKTFAPKASYSLKIGMIQANIPQEDKWSAAKSKINLDSYRAEEARLAKAGAGLIIWPEAAYPISVSTELNSIDPDTLGLGGQKSDLHTLTGLISETPSGDYYNSAFLFDGSGNIIGKYHKAHLVPFGEYIPYKKILFFARKLTAPVGNFLAGSSFEPLSMPGAKFGVLICYEDIFPEIARKMTLKGAEFLTNLTNDAWYGWSSAAFQHTALSVFRAVENRRWLVRATNSGVTAVIDPRGRILTQSNLFEKSTTVAAIAGTNYTSLYTRLGDWLAWGCIAYGALLIISLLWRRRWVKN